MNVSDKSCSRYYIKPEYQPNLAQATYDSSESPTYWSAERLHSAAVYQFDVYRIAANYAAGGNCRSILDVGSGPPVKMKALMPTGADIYLADQPNTQALAAQFMPEARFFPVNLEKPLPDLPLVFDLVICADVIEHLVDPDPCLDFLRRHLAPAGLLLISTPERDILRGKNCVTSPHPMHVREWNKQEFGAFLKSRGLEIVEHRLLPQKRSSPLKSLYGKILTMLGFPPSWYSCQLAVCRLMTRHH